MTSFWTKCPIPKIKEYLDPHLLSRPTPEFKDSSRHLIRMYRYITLKLKNKINPENISMLREYEELEKQFIEVYERITKKEEERKEQIRHKTQKPFYSITIPDRRIRKLFEGLRYRSYRVR